MLKKFKNVVYLQHKKSKNRAFLTTKFWHVSNFKMLKRTKYANLITILKNLRLGRIYEKNNNYI